MVVRELVALLGIKTDTASIKRAESSVNNLGNNLQGLTSRFGDLFKTIGLTFGVFKAIQFAKDIIFGASAVNENLNVLDAAFKENQNSVIEWSKTFAQAAGRSQYGMQEMAATLGAVLNPMMDKNSEVTAKMSTRLSELTVDLASFYNAAEPDVLRALRAGITGEAEPLKRFGIVMNEATLKAYALRAGINKNIKSMSIAEKTQLRYNFILDQTTASHGDAIKTSGGFANASKRLMARMKDVGISIGLKLLPTIEKIIPALISITDGSEFFVDALGNILRVGVKAIEWVVRFIGYIFKLVSNMDPARKKILLFGAALIGLIKLAQAPFGKWALILAAIVLIIDDFITFMEGGESVIGKFNDALKDTIGIDLKQFFEGIGIFLDDLADKSKDSNDVINALWKEAVDVVEGYFAAAGETWSNWISDFSDMTGNAFRSLFGDTITNILFSFWDTLISLFQSSYEVILWPFDKLLDFIVNVFTIGINDALNALWGSISDTFKSGFTSLSESFNGILSLITEGITGFISNMGGWLSELTSQFVTWTKELPGKLWGKAGDFASWLFGKGDTDVNASVSNISKVQEQLDVNTISNLSRGVQAATEMTAVAASPLRASSTKSTVNNNNDMRTTVEVNVTGTSDMSADQLSVKVGEQVERVMERKNREAMRALVTRAAG